MTSKIYRSTIAVILATIIFLLGFTAARLVPAEDAPSQSGTIQTESEYVSVIIDAGNDKSIISPEIPWENNLTAFKALQKLSEQATFDLEYKDYGGEMGVFITAIDGLRDETKKKWWQFWVNGKYAEKGASSYGLQPGDSVYWKLSSQMQ